MNGTPCGREGLHFEVSMTCVDHLDCNLLYYNLRMLIKQNEAKMMKHLKVKSWSSPTPAALRWNR